MFKVVRSYSKKAERKHESSAQNSQQQQQQQSFGNGGGGSSYYEEYRSNGNLAANGNGNGHYGQHQHHHQNGGGGGQLMADNKHLAHAYYTGTAGGGFSESSSYETREHFERKVQRVKKTRGERERSRSIRRDEVSEALHGSDATSARDALLQWARKVTAGYPRVNVTNFSSSWRDGLAFNAILHRYRPDIIDWNKISSESVSNRERLDHAFAAAEKEFGVSRLLDAEDVDTNNPDEKSIITYVSSLYNALPHLPELNRGNVNDLISRLERGIGITNEKLDLILKRIEDVEARVDTSPPAAVERTVTEIIEDLNALEHPIAGLFEDVEELKTNAHPEANEYYRRVYGLHQRRTAYLDRLTNQILVRLGVRTDTLHKENLTKLENARQTSFSRVEECIEWVRVRMEKLTTMEFLEDLETLENMFEQHKLDNRDIQDFRQNVDECIARQAEVSAEDTYEYCELLRVLESEYQQLRDLSAGRMLDLDSLIAFVRAAQLELIWVSEREEIEVTRNWSDIKQLDLPMLTNYYKQLLHEMELREKQYNDVHNQGAALLNQGHPAIHVIEAYLRTMQNQWDWLLALSKCLEEHLRDALNLKSFMEEASDAEAWIEEQSTRLENNYNRTDFSLEEGERFLRELDEIKDILNKYHGVLMALTERCATISPLWQRGERIPHPINVTALCDYADKNITIKAGDDVVLLDNSDLIKWTVRDLSGVEGLVPSVVFRIPPPDGKLTAFLNRLLQQFEKLKKLWEKKHRMVRFNMVLNTMRTIQGWDLDTFNSIDPDQRDAIMKALNDDANKLLSELDPNDPLALRLREELRKTNEHFWNLLNASQKPPEPDWSSQYDQKMSELLRKLEEAWRRLNDNVGKPVSRTPEDLERVIHEHKRFEDALQALDGDVANVKELFRQLPNPTPTQRVNHDRLNGLWDDLWDLSRMYVERIKVLESVLNGMVEVADIVKQHEITLNSFDDLPAALDQLRGHHSQLLEINMVLKQQQTVVDQLNRNVALLRQHVARTRINEGHHPDVDAIEEEVQKLNVRWENVQSQIADRLKAVEQALQIQMVYRSEYETEMSWLDTVEETINRLRKPDELRPEEYQKQLDLLVAEYSHLQEHTASIENVNKEGGKFIREAKTFDAKMGQYSDAIVGVHGPEIRQLFRRTKPQPKNGSQIVTEELELLNRRFAQLSSLILERRNTLQVLIQNWKRQKQENVAQVISYRETEISDMISDLGRFKQDIFTSHLTFDPNPQSVETATKNVQKVKESLDSWRDRIKERLDAIDELCRDEAETLTPEQFATLREKRRLLAEEYDTVLRNVENIHTRLNILAALLIEFSSLTSSMQSWMTDRTRVGGDIRHRSADPEKFEQARLDARTLLGEVQREESRLKNIGASVCRIEKEIEEMYEDVRSASTVDSIPSGVGIEEIHTTQKRVDDDYVQLLKQCQDLLQFQNRVHSMNDQHAEQAKRADEWLGKLYEELDSVERAKIPDNELVERIEELNRMAAGGSSQLDEAEIASKRLLNELEGTSAAEDVRKRHETLASQRRNKHRDVLERLQQNMNEAASRRAEADGVKNAIENMQVWSEQVVEKSRQPVELALNETALNEAKRDEQVLSGEIESRLVILDQLELKTDDPEIAKNILNIRQRLKRSKSDLKGVRDNIYDALNGLHLINSNSEKATRSLDTVANKIRNGRDSIDEIEADLDGVRQNIREIEEVTRNVINIPNVTKTEPVLERNRDLRKRVDSCADEIETRRNRLADQLNLDAQLDDAKDRTSEWLNRFEEDLKGLEKVSIDKEKLAEQRKETLAMIDRHEHGQKQIDELEGIVRLLEDPQKVVKASNFVSELNHKIQRQAGELKNRGDRINRNDVKASALLEAEDDVNKWIEKRKETLTAMPIPTTKEGVKSQLMELERMDKSGRGEQRRVEEVRLTARELARDASIEAEAEEVTRREKMLAENWESLADQFEATRERARNGERLLDDYQQIDKWLAAKQKMLETIGAPSTDVGVSRAQIGQINLMSVETDGEKQALDGLNTLANELVGGSDDATAQELMNKMDTLNRRWHSLESGIEDKSSKIGEASKLGEELKQIYKQLKNEIGELESNVEKASAMSSSDVRDQLSSLDNLKSRFGGVDKSLDKLKRLLETADDLEIDANNRAEIKENLEAHQKKADEIERKIDNVKKAALNAQNQEVELEKKLDDLLAIVQMAENEMGEAAPICADETKLDKELKRAEEIYGKLIENDGDYSLLRAKLSDELKKKPDQNLKRKLDELNGKWGKVVNASRDRKDTISKVGELVKQFTDAEKTLEQRLRGDGEELESLIQDTSSREKPQTEVCDGLKLVEMTMARRLADVDALNAVMSRIEQNAPGADANRLRRKADKLADDCNGMSKKARQAAAQAQRQQDFKERFERLVEEVGQFAESQKAKIEEAMERDQMNHERVQSKTNEIDDFWSLKHRELKSAGDEIKSNGNNEDVIDVDTKIDTLQTAINYLLELLKQQNERIDEKKEAVERIQRESQKTGHKINSLIGDIGDLDAIGRSRDELKKQKVEVDELANELAAAETKLIELAAEWDAAMEAGIVTRPVHETNKATIDELNKIAARARKRLVQRDKKLEETGDEIEKLHEEAQKIVNDLDEVAKNEILEGERILAEPKMVAEKVKMLKESMKPIGEKMEDFNSDCKLMIKTAGPEGDTSELDSLLKKVGMAWSDVVGKVGDREMTVDAAVQQQGKVEDAFRSLINWLEETEEMLENQKRPSADAKVAKAQLHAYEVLMKHVEDKQASIDGFSTMIAKSEGGGGEEAAALKAAKNDEVKRRYFGLLENAHERQRRLLDAVDLAERLQEVAVPFEQWLNLAEKRLSALSKIPITVERAQEMLNEQAALQDELEFKCDELKATLEIAPLLSSLVSVEDANNVSGQVQQLEHRARGLDNGITTMRPLLEEFLQQIQDFTLDSDDLAQWLDETKLRLGELDELPIAPDDLVEQSNILGEIGAAIADRYETVTSIIEVGTQLAIQGESEEAILVQRNVDNLKFRYSDLTSSADEKIALLAKAIPLSDMFHNGFDGVMEWLEIVEQDLQQIDDEDAETQADQIFCLEEDISKWRPEVDELTAISTQLQALCSPEKADELLQNTVEMNKMVNSVADRVSRRAERIEMQKKQSRAVLDDLCYLVDWFVNARDRIDAATAGHLSLDPEYLRTQLKHQKLMNDDVYSNKVELKNVSNEAKKVVRQLGAEGTDANAELLDKCEQGKELVDEVQQLCSARTEILEKGLVLTEQLADQFDGLNEWLDQMDDELQHAANVTTATPANELRAMHDHNSELAQQMATYRPIVDGLKENVGALQDICGQREAESLGEITNDVIARFDDVKEAIRARGQAIDNTMNATIGFGERLETLVANLQGAADRLKENEGISADPSVLESRLAENLAIRESLRDKQTAYDALRQSAGELLAAVPSGDAAGGEVENKLERLDKLWREIEREADEQGGLLEDVLGKSKRFWNELDACQKAVDDLRTRLELVEPATGSPEQLADQQQLMSQVASEMENARPRIEALSVAGNDLSTYVSPEEQAVIGAQVGNVQSGFSTITALFAEKKRDLITAMEEAMVFHGDLKSLLNWLDKAENHVGQMTPVESAKQINDIGELLDQLHRFKDEVDEKGITKEQIVTTANQLVIDSPPHLAANVRQPINELNGRWARLLAVLTEREHKLENAMLQMGKLTDAIDQLTAWMDKTRVTLVEIAPPQNAVNLRDVEIAQCKLVVVSNDVHAHQNSVAALNEYRNKAGVDRETLGRLDEMNLKWDEIQKMLAILSKQIEKSKKEAENVGGEVERWQVWLDEVEAQLMSTKPTGGLPETAEQQLDEFHILKADVEQNAADIEKQIESLASGEKDSWMDKTYGGMRTKWSKIGELLVDREKKLQLAYEQAVMLENALNDMEQWIVDSERKLSDLAPISRLPETVDKQLSDHETWMDEVVARKQQMAQHQATGVRMQYYCEKKDAIPIKNRLVSLKHRCEKVATRTAERAKQLTAARDEVDAWQDGIVELDAFVMDIVERIGGGEPMTSSLEKLKIKLEEVKEAQRDVSAKQTLFDITRKRGIVLAEHATRNEYKIIASQNEKLAKRWNEMVKKLRDRLREVEQGVLEGGAFEESMNDLEGWVDGELERYHHQESSPLHGDVDTVRHLADEEKRRSQERKNKENGIKMIVKKADGLLANGAEESETIREAKDRLVEKWEKVEEMARVRCDSIKEAGKEAEEFDAKAHALLDWLAVEEQKLKAPVTDVKKAIIDVEQIKSEMSDAKPNYETCLTKGAELLEKCQPAAEQTLKNWVRVVEARWKEVSEKVDEREFTLLEDEQKEKEKDELIARLVKFAALKREQLNGMIDRAQAEDLDTIDEHLKEMAELDGELREKQSDIDSACKSGGKKGGQKKNVAADMLSNEWKKLWLDAMGLQSSLDAQKALLEEMKRLEGWKWEDWKERYVEWNDHAKARVSDLFRRIDRLHTGNVPRQVFIDGIIGSKFPTSRLEMEKVADLFDKGDGMINSKEFINALRFDSSNRNAKPQTDTEKITHEIERQKKTCSCCQPYQIEKISDNHYRFGDTHIKRMVRILRSTVMVRVGGGWESLDEFLHKHDPCRAKGRLNINMFPEAKPNHALDSMRAFTKNRHAKETGSSATPGPIMKIREKTDRSVPMSGGLGGTAGYTPISSGSSRIPRAPSDLSAGRLSAANSRSSLADAATATPSRPSSRASSDDGKQSRIPSLRMKKGARYNPPSTPK